MRVGTLSLNINTDDLNYGAMLHSWAFQQVLKQQECVQSTEIIDYTTKILEGFAPEHPVLSYARKKRWKSAVKLALSGSAYKKRLAKFKAFQKKHMIVSSKRYRQGTIGKTKLPYDCLICESDVIWSPKFFYEHLDPVFFLNFPSAQPCKRIIYAASMANADFTPATLKQLKKYAQAPDHISCRESFAVNIVNKYTDRSAKHVLDPVLLLKKEDYDPICAKRLVKEPYLLLYIPLGYNSDYQKAAKKYAKENGLKVIELSYFTWNNLSHTVIADAGIEDFLSLIRNAEVVFTNSFHAVCFSLLFHVDFYAFARKTGRKTEDFCSWIGISERYLDILKFKKAEPIDYEKIDKILEQKRKESLEWLAEALEK